MTLLKSFKIKRKIIIKKKLLQDVGELQGLFEIREPCTYTFSALQCAAYSGHVIFYDFKRNDIHYT